MAAGDVVVTELLNDTHGSPGLHQRLLALGTTSGIADGVGEAWYVAAGTGDVSAPVAHSLSAGCAMWLPGGAAYSVSGDELRIVAVTVLAGNAAVAGPHVVRFDDCTPEWTGDRQFRVLLSAGLTVTQFVGVIPPGRAPAHQHTYDEVVHVLSGSGVVHLPAGDRPIAPGNSIYLAPGTPHCLENTGTGDLRVLGVFHPAGSPAAKTVTASDSPLRNVAKKAGPHGQVGSTEPVVLRDTARSSIVVNPWFVERSSGEIETSLKFTLDRKTAGPRGTRRAEIALNPEEVFRLHEVLHGFLNLSGESEGDYIVVPVAADDRPNAGDTARKLADVLRQPGVANQLAALGLSADVAGALHGAARIADLRAAVAELRNDLDGGLTLERVYQEWCDRHSWALGNAYVAKDEVRGIAVGDQVDLLMQSSESGLRDVFELKRPNMPVISFDKSHKSWHWSQDAAKAIGQCHRYLDALHEAAQRGLRDHPEVLAYHPRAFIVVGRSAGWTEDKQRALHGLNTRMHAITVMTYDHLLARAEAMLAVLDR